MIEVTVAEIEKMADEGGMSDDFMDRDMRNFVRTCATPEQLGRFHDASDRIQFGLGARITVSSPGPTDRAQQATPAPTPHTPPKRRYTRRGFLKTMEQSRSIVDDVERHAASQPNPASTFLSYADQVRHLARLDEALHSRKNYCIVPPHHTPGLDEPIHAPSP
jgi:hypothetical protein